MPLILDGNGDITGLVAGALPSTVIGAGGVLQVVSNTSGNPVTTSGGTFVTSGITASITPTSSSSRILILASFPCTITASTRQLTFTLFRNNTTNLAPNNSGALGYGQIYNDGGNLQGVQRKFHRFVYRHRYRRWNSRG